jgi:glycosyltransferase involved in cell wall biosynthesis
MSYTILNVAYPFAPVRTDTAGGAEQIILTIDAGLVDAGHRSLVAACSRSVCRGTLLPTLQPAGTIDDALRARVWRLHRRTITTALRTWPVDLVHMHGIDFYAYLPPPGVPVLVTLHLPIAWYPSSMLQADRPGLYFNCVSASQHASCPPLPALLPCIENGVAVEALAGERVSRCGFALCLGRICPEKGYHLALDAAARAGVDLILAGCVFDYPAHRRYFREQILPRLDGRKYRFIGPVGFARKRRLLSAARCVLLPSLAAETSSLVAMEALACGTPVIAFAAGALAEIVEDGRTGFLVSDEREMAAALGRVGQIDNATCRATALARFSDRTMVGRYLQTYDRIIRGSPCCGSS